MKNKRLFYLDFVRTIAVFSILLTHYNAHFLEYYMQPAMPERAIITLYPFNIYIGALGVALFFIISGASLMYVYQDQCHLKTFYHKRFLSIYPMFWIGYVAVFLFYFYRYKHMVYLDLPKPNFLLTILGMDGYLTGTVPTYYLIGEWFLGCIIIMYILFPLLRKLLLSHPYLLCTGIILLFIPFAFWEIIPSFTSSKIVFVRLPELVFGMIFIYKIKTVRPWMAILSLIVLIFNSILKPSVSMNLQTLYVGIAFFIILVYISNWLDRPAIHSICRTISKYSFAIFLTHHVVVDTLTSTFSMTELVRSERYLLFILYCCITAFLSWILYHLHSHIMSVLRKTVSQQK